MNAPHKFLALLFLISSQLNAQPKASSVQPGRIYESGETLYSPRFGFTGKVPVGWEGMLPRESEVFLLMSSTATQAEVFIFGRDEGNLNSLQQAWKNGLALSESIQLKAVDPIITEDVLFSDVIAEGEYVNKTYKSYAVARCNPNGPCITTLMIAPPQYYEVAREMVVNLMKSSSFSPPSNASPYENFDWNDFLSNTMLVTYASIQGGTKENTLHFCGDGTFTSKISTTGYLKNQNSKYQGRNSGTWIVTGSGENATIQLTFKKKNLPPLEAPLTIRDEKVFSNGDRYFVGKSDKCK